MTILEQQLNFLREIDRLKAVVRQSPLLDQSRRENSAEHSWHLAMYALILNEYASGAVNTSRVIQMLLLDDIVEIDVGIFRSTAGLLDVKTRLVVHTLGEQFRALALPFFECVNWRLML